MAELMNAADLALGAGGTTTWERLALGLPSIVTAIADNQIEICENCARAGLVHYLGQPMDVSEKTLVQVLHVFLKHEKLRCFAKTIAECYHVAVEGDGHV